MEYFAVDSYDPADGTARRVAVFTGEKTARKQVKEEFARDEGGTFWRITRIGEEEAWQWTEGMRLGDYGELVSVARAAKELGITRQTMNSLVLRGIIPSVKIDGTRVGMYSIALRKAEHPGPGRKRRDG